MMLEIAGATPRGSPPKTVSKAFDRGDVLAKELVARTSHYLGVGFANLVNISTRS